MSSIACYIDTNVKLHAVIDILRALVARGHEVTCYLPVEIQESVSSLLPPSVVIQDSDALLKGQHLSRAILRRLRAAATSSWISNTAISRQESTSLGNWMSNCCLSVLFWACEPKLYNQRMERLVSRFVTKRFSEDAVIVVTRPAERLIFAHRGTKVVSVMESWDHPSKDPLGFTSDLVLVWNLATAEAWKNYQGDTNVRIGFPAKLSYALEARPERLPVRRDINLLLYPMTFCSNSGRGQFQEELRLVARIAQALQRAGVSLYVKPKPNSVAGELSGLLTECSNVSIGEYNRQCSNTYQLTDSYNQIRLEELGRTDGVVNLGTTFALDSAAYGMPVLQLVLQNKIDFPALTKIASYDHLKSTLLARPELTLTVSDFHSLEVLASSHSVREIFEERALEFSNILYQWIVSGVDGENWEERCCCEIESVIARER